MENRGKPKAGKTCVFAMTQQEAAQEPETMACMLSVFGIPALILFDTEATHSFISSKLFKLKVENDKICGDVLEVSILSGKTIKTNQPCREVRNRV